jgi:hypothetical protein
VCADAGRHPRDRPTDGCPLVRPDWRQAIVDLKLQPNRGWAVIEGYLLGNGDRTAELKGKVSQHLTHCAFDLL